MTMIMIKTHRFFCLNIWLPVLVVYYFYALKRSHAFLSITKTTTTTNTRVHSSSSSFVDTIQTRIKIAQKSNADGYGFKQVLADVIAGDDFDEEGILNTIDETIASAPCGTFMMNIFFVFKVFAYGQIRIILFAVFTQRFLVVIHFLLSLPL